MTVQSTTDYLIVLDEDGVVNWRLSESIEVPNNSIGTNMRTNWISPKTHAAFKDSSSRKTGLNDFLVPESEKPGWAPI